jgi:Dolichyl-phosphate-mannose-protein mannosyltransferase
MTSINNQEKKGSGLLSGGKFGGAAPQGNVASPMPSNPEHLPTGYLPSQAQNAPAPKGKGAGPAMPGGQGNNQQPQNKGLLGGQRANMPQPPANKGGLLSGQPPRPPAGPPQPPPPGPRGPMGPPPGGPGGPGYQGPPGPQYPGNRQGPPPGQMPAPPLGPTGQVVLQRTENFYVQATIHPNKRTSVNPLRKPSGHTTTMPKVVPNQEERVAESETRMMPALDVPDEVEPKRKLIPSWFEVVIVAIGVLASLIAHAYNMFNYPRYEMDEGTYMSAAWAVVNGKIYPYAYGYGHPPFAWMQLAGLVQLAGGFFLFGNAINTGRFLMLFYTLGSTLLVYLIIRKTTDSRTAGLLALIIFAFSPLSVTFQRMVLLDNIATFWFLLSLYLMVISRSRLPLVALSAICFGLSLLSKEVMVFFIPGMIYGIWIHATKFQRKFVMVAFVYAFIAISSLWVLMAVLKGELFPPGWLPWDKGQHLSFLGTFTSQVGRGQAEGSITTSIQDWYSTDQPLIIMSIVSLAFNVLVGWWRRKQLFFAILGISFWLLLIRGGVVLTFYLIPLIPLVAINAALMVNTLADWIGSFVRLDLLRAFLVTCVLCGFAFYDGTHSDAPYHANVTIIQTETMDWIRNNVPRNSYVVMNSYLYMDMHASGGEAVGDGSIFPNSDVYVQIANDPTMIALEGGNWDRVDYIIADSQVYSYITGPQLPTAANFLKQALLQHSGPIGPDGKPIPCASFKSISQNYEIDIYCIQHTQARPVAMASPGGSSPGGNTSLPTEGTTAVDRRSLVG